MQQVIERLKGSTLRESTKHNYITVWRSFNKFLLRLDAKPNLWEDRVAMFCAYLIDRGGKSATIKSYVLAIKAILILDGHEWSDRKLLLLSLAKACRIKNDVISCRLPIQRGLLEIILFEVCRMFDEQMYLKKMYLAVFCLAYYGLMRIGKLTDGNHPLKAKNVHIGMNKNKILLILYSSKTHSKADYPQEIKISGPNLS